MKNIFRKSIKDISKKKDPMKDHEKFKNIKNKFKEHFSENPGK